MIENSTALTKIMHRTNCYYSDNSARVPWLFEISVVCCVVAKEATHMAKKRANGEGSIRKRKDGRWEGRYTAGHDPETGKAIYKNVLG